MKTDFDIRAVTKKATGIVSRYQILLFFIVVSVFIVLAIIMILKIFNDSPPVQTQSTTQLISNENKETVKKLSELRSSDSLKDLPEPSGRFSPFFESEWNTDIMK